MSGQTLHRMLTLSSRTFTVPLTDGRIAAFGQNFSDAREAANLIVQRLRAMHPQACQRIAEYAAENSKDAVGCTCRRYQQGLQN